MVEDNLIGRDEIGHSCAEIGGNSASAAAHKSGEQQSVSAEGQPAFLLNQCDILIDHIQPLVSEQRNFCFHPN